MKPLLIAALALGLALHVPDTAAAEDGTMVTERAKAHALLPFLGFKMTFGLDFTTHTLGSVTVVEVGSGSFAEKANLKVGDAIVAVNGRAIVGMQPIELTTFIRRRPPEGGTFDYQLTIERGLSKRRIVIAFAAGSPGSGPAKSQTPDTQVDLESSDGGWGSAVGGVDRLTLQGVVVSFEMYKLSADNPNLSLYRVTPGPSSEAGREDVVWRIPYHEPFQHTVPSFAKWSPPNPREDARKAKEQAGKFIAGLTEK